MTRCRRFIPWGDPLVRAAASTTASVTLAAYDSVRDFLTRTSSSTGACYGCRSGQIPDILAFALCT
jgi:hypothetical protein